MKARQHQNGYVFQHGKWWYLRYRVLEMQTDGSFKNAQKCTKLVLFGGQYRSKRAVKPLAQDFLAPYNTNSASLLSTVTLNHWMEKHYLPMIKDGRKRSVYPDYFNKWNRYIRPNGDIPMREFRTSHAQGMLRMIVASQDLSRTTLQHIKSLLSGAFTYAIRQDVLNGSNPVRYAEVPRVRGPKDTYAYTLEEILARLNVLQGKARAVMAVASFAGLRDSELRGLRWEDYDDKQVSIERAVWRGTIDDTKTEASKAPVPVLEILAGYLDAYRLSLGTRASGFMFATGKGTPMDLQMFAQRAVRPALEAAGLKWHGYHACRRGLATNLKRLGVSDNVIKNILRHSSVEVTRRSYIKMVDPDSIEAMEKLQCATAVQQLASSQQGDEAKKAADAAEVSENTQVVGTGGEGGIRTPDTAFDRITV